MTEQETNEMTTDLNTLNEVLGIPKVAKAKPKKVQNVYPIAFVHIPRGDKFVIRTAQAVKISPTEAVLLKSGKIIKLAASKVVKKSK